MSELSTINRESVLPETLNPKTPDLNKWAVELYDKESKKPGGGNPEVKELLWLIGLRDSSDKEELFETAVEFANRIPSSALKLDEKKKLIEILVRMNPIHME